MTRSKAQFPNKLALGSSIALPKGVGGVQLSEIVCSSEGKITWAQAGQVVLRSYLAKRLRQKGVKERSEGEKVSALEIP